jgi:hypothetical protein
LVEQRTENPCVGSSILPLATSIQAALLREGRFYFWPVCGYVTTM